MIAAKPDFSGIHNPAYFYRTAPSPKIMAINILPPSTANSAAAPFEFFVDEWVGVAAEEVGELLLLLLSLDEVGDGDEDAGVSEALRD
jgi:hypothetical protein